MSETLLLILFAAAILVIIFGIRTVMKSRKIVPLSPRIEAAIRIGLCLLFALIAFVIYHTLDNAWDAASVLSSALLIYGATHLFDRFFFRK